MYDVLSSRKKNLKRFPSLKFRRSKSEILRPPLLESGSSWARYFHSGSYTCDVIYLTRDWWSLDFREISVGFWLKYLRNVCRFRSSIWEKICQKAVVKVAVSLQRLASARQVKISNHTMIVPTEEEATQLYAEQIAAQKKKSLRTCFWVDLLTREIYQTGILFGFFVSILSALINTSISVKRASFK